MCTSQLWLDVYNSCTSLVLKTNFIPLTTIASAPFSRTEIAELVTATACHMVATNSKFNDEVALGAVFPASCGREFSEFQKLFIPRTICVLVRKGGAPGADPRTTFVTFNFCLVLIYQDPLRTCFDGTIYFVS